jgi:hypothetical protein
MHLPRDVASLRILLAVSRCATAAEGGARAGERVMMDYDAIVAQILVLLQRETGEQYDGWHY